MIKLCPVSTKNVNENVSRLNAFYTFLFVVGFLLTKNPVFAAILVFDFGLRNILEGRFNPVIRFNRFIADTISLPRTMINAGPKIFAARVGLFLALLGSVLLFSVSFEAALVVFSILGFFSFMEFALNYCVACKLYPYILPLNKLFQ